MALWQFALNPIPAAAAKICGIEAVCINRDVLNEGCLDLPQSQQPVLFDTLAALLPEQPAWGEGMRVWGSTKGNDIQVFFDGPRVESVEFRLDVSRLSIPLVDGICAPARKFGWVFVSETSAVLQPTREAVLRAVEHSHAQKFVRDPEATLRQIHPVSPGSSSRVATIFIKCDP
jgi:hypothetical protein